MKISIITPCRNSEKTLERTIKSVVLQSLSEQIEYIIVDGKSTDNTLKIIKKYAREYNFIKYISEKDNSMTEALNKGIKMATGDIIASINADDVYLPNTLQKVCDAYKKDSIDILLINTYFIDKNNFIKSHNTPRYFSPFLCSIIECPFPECAIFFKKKCFDELGYFNENIKYTQDLEFYLRLYYAGYKFIYKNIDGSCFFTSSTNYSSTISNKMRNEVLTYIKHKMTYKYVSGTIFSKLLKILLRIRFYYLIKNQKYEDLLEEYRGSQL